MTTLEFFERELKRCEVNLEQQTLRNAPQDNIENIRHKINHYTVACELLRAEKALHKINHNSLCETETYKVGEINE